MSETIKENIECKAEKIREILLPIGEVLEFEDGLSVYVIPIETLKSMREKDLKDIKKELEARELVKESEERVKKKIAEGWTEDDFKRQFREAHHRIIEVLSTRTHERRKGK